VLVCKPALYCSQAVTLIINALIAGVLPDAGQFVILEALIEGFEAREFLYHHGRDGLAWVGSGDLRMRRKEPECALVPEAPRQFAHGFRMRARFCGSLGGSPILKED